MHSTHIETYSSIPCYPFVYHVFQAQLALPFTKVVKILLDWFMFLAISAMLLWVGMTLNLSTPSLAPGANAIKYFKANFYTLV